MAANNDTRLVWIDLEMSGLDFSQDRILELACIVTDANLNPVGDELELVIHQSDELLEGMDEWNTRTHNGSGLVERVRASTYTEQQVEHMVLEHLRPLLSEDPAVLCGNSICTDRRFIARYMTALDGLLHYRMIDVSSVKLLAQYWRPDLSPHKSATSVAHRALDDIRQSIEELRFYRSHWLVSSPAEEA